MSKYDDIASTQPIILGSRGSPLARVQTALATEAITQRWPHAEVRRQTYTTSGDRLPGSLIHVGGKGLFTQEIEAALLSGEIDIAVHSLKDIPARMAPGTHIGAVLERGDARDTFLSPSGGCIADLLPGARVGTSSPRRAAFIRRVRPDVEIVPMRGNIETRLAKLAAGAADATLLAQVALDRLNIHDWQGMILDPEEMLPAVGQGVIALQTRIDDARMNDILAPVGDAVTTQCILAERAFLERMDGSCHTPLAGYATWDATIQEMTLHAALLTEDGAALYETVLSGTWDAAQTLGHTAAEKIIAACPPQVWAQLKGAPK